ncbi:NRDE protein-domain-containing protein [Phycomyces nitens]|nr:NRDE protein-domain-containing protein [Phycomyces nitens]
MCILFWTVEGHPKYRFVFAGNRDEFLNRPSSKAHFWKEPNQNVLAGTDLQEGSTPLHNGSWLGITRQGRFAALTNFREKNFKGRFSRGILVRDFLTASADQSVDDYVSNIEKHAEEFGGFNLICMDLGKKTDMVYFGNRGNASRTELEKGVLYGLSNSTLASPWPKVNQGCEMFKSILSADRTEDQLIQDLFELLRTTSPLTNVCDIDQVMADITERIFVPLFRNSEFMSSASYGTRTSTVVLVDHEGRTTFVERDIYDTIVENDGKVKYIPKKASLDQDQIFRFNITES